MTNFFVLSFISKTAVKLKIRKKKLTVLTDSNWTLDSCSFVEFVFILPKAITIFEFAVILLQMQNFVTNSFYLKTEKKSNQC